MTAIQPSNDRREGRIWLAAILVAALGTWVMYDAFPGINWGIWTAAAALGLLLHQRTQLPRAVVIPAIGAVVIAFGSAITGDEFINFLSVLSVIVLLAFAMLLSPDPRLKRITAAFFIASPIVAFATALLQALQRASSALQLVRSHRARSVVRGTLITIPVIIVFALLLSNADPIFAGWRESIRQLLASWEFLPRTFFFFAILAITLGAYGYAVFGEARPGPLADRMPAKFIGATERLILLTSVAVLFWVFLAVQLSYLFGNLPQVQGSGMTFAEYAQRGFAELTVVATASALLILVSERFGHSDQRTGQIRIATIAVLVAVLFLLVSAFNRVLLYEEAYGFTTARLYAQVYMLLVAFALIALGWEMRGELDASRLFRRVFTTATLAFIVLIYWNHHAWIANKNIDRLASTGKLDTAYLGRDLGIDAVPTLVKRLPTIPEPFQTDLRGTLLKRYEKRPRMFSGPWYEWNLRRREAGEALKTLNQN